MNRPTPPVNRLASLLAAGARARGLDLNALLAIARHEGASGGIGDGGHAFGPFQLNNAGGVLTGRFHGASPQQLNAWAWSPEGINFALDRIAGVARGLRGAQAIRAITTRFERPANPGAEIADALAHYGAPLPAAGPPGFPGGGAGGVLPRPGGRNVSPLLASVVAQTNESLGLGSNPALASLLAAGAPQPPRALGAVTPQPTTSATPHSIRGLYRGFTVGGNVDRVSGGSLPALIRFARPYGLTLTATTNGQHAPHSYHYQQRATDWSGGASQMAALARAALAHPQGFAEVIYTGPGNSGYSILGGKIVRNSQLPAGLAAEHVNHVHLAR